MKRLLIVLLLLGGFMAKPQKASAQAQEIAQLVLNVQKLNQLKSILEDLEKGYEIVIKGYTTIKNLAEGNFKLHDLFLAELLKVSPTVRNYYKVVEITDMQLRLVKEYKTAFQRFRSGNRFTTDELDYIARVYAKLLGQSLRNLDELLMTVTDNKLRASDDERLKAIDQVHARMQEKLVFLRDFNRNVSVLAVQRAKAAHEAEVLLQIQGID
ncbi:hypothetical protein GCM10023091_00610 [Ravibacter arvi]|uniref:TerB family tellurite resistance protein n=1 Tax=Ravibacter arvi TaxID=2051041 RepID=A0ABP8LK71_9BACT